MYGVQALFSRLVVSAPEVLAKSASLTMFKLALQRLID